MTSKSAKKIKNCNKICTFFLSIQVYLCLGKILYFKKIKEIHWFTFIFTYMHYMKINYYRSRTIMV